MGRIRESLVPIPYLPCSDFICVFENPTFAYLKIRIRVQRYKKKMIHAIFLIKNLKLKIESRKNSTILRLTTGQRLMRLITVLCSLEQTKVAILCSLEYRKLAILCSLEYRKLVILCSLENKNVQFYAV